MSVSAEQQDHPSFGLAIVSCMDARVDPAAIASVAPAVLITNAGGLVTDDVCCALALARHQAGLSEIWVVMHADCQMHGLDSEAFVEKIEAETGGRPGWNPGGFTSPEAELRSGIERLRSEPLLAEIRVRGFVLESGRLRAFDAAD